MDKRGEYCGGVVHQMQWKRQVVIIDVAHRLRGVNHIFKSRKKGQERNL